MAPPVAAKAPVTRSASQPAAVSKGYNFASTWEQNAPLMEDQLATITILAHVAMDRQLPPHVSGEANGGPDALLPAPDGRLPHGAAPDVALLNSHQFYKWHSDLEAAMKSETEEKYRQYVDTLTSHVVTCDAILGQVDSTLSLFDDLQVQHRAVAVKTKSLHDACERLVLEKERLLEFADALRSKLNYFDELEKIATKFHAPTMSVGSSHFLPLLKRLDECISYVGSNLQYADSNVYLVKFRQLQSRALGMVRSHVLSVLRSASGQVQGAMRDSAGVSSSGGHVTISEGAETSLLYVRFKAAAGELKGLMEEMEHRTMRKEYTQLLSDCHTVYCEQRLGLVQGVVAGRMAEYARKELLPALTRSGCAYLMQVCQLEHQLFDHFFPASSADASNLAPLIDPLCTQLYDVLRPRFIQCADLDLLCELVDILKAEVLEEQLARRGDTCAALRPTMLRTLADVQERLTFRAQTFMRDEINNYMPTSEELDYPAILQRAAYAQSAEPSAVAEDEEGRDAYAAWYPPLEKTLSCLSKLYCCVDQGIFTGLAQEAVAVCSASIQRASKVIARRPGSTPMDAQLFLIKHLLILREQIAPFDIEFAVTVKELDFSHMLEQMRRIMRGQASFFGSSNSFSRFSPRVTESHIDAKKELEKSLKATCEAFIMSITKSAVEPFLSFLTKVTAVKVTQGAGKSDAPAAPGRSLREQAFATPSKLAEMVEKVQESLNSDLPQVVASMKLYLQSPSTQAILFRPIKSNILEAHSQVLKLVEAEYSIEDQAVIKLPQPSSLQLHLDELVKGTGIAASST